MKNTNILSLVQAHNSLKQANFDSYLKHYNISIKTAELQDLECLVTALREPSGIGCFFDRFYIGYTIPQIGKEFDLLRFGKEFVVNVELKKVSTEAKIKKQLIRNKYYLSNLDKVVYNFSFEADSGLLYLLNSDDALENVDVAHLRDLLIAQEIDEIDIVDSFFNPSDFLVSPFNSTQKFLDNHYFLTKQQEEIKDKIISSINISTNANFISVVGSAGTGKTLLIYDIVKELKKQGKNALIIHCGSLNLGQETLKNFGWEIAPIKRYAECKLSAYDLIVIDEAQRIKAPQLEEIVNLIFKDLGNCIFSYDKLQTLATWEEKINIDGKINKLNPLTTYKLTEKIRTNKEIATFIKMLFNNKKNIVGMKKGNVEINYFQDLSDARHYLESLDGDIWEVLRFTPSLFGKEHHEKYSQQYAKTSHKVIGQEFDGVVVTIDQFFSYNDDGDLSYGGTAYYYPVKMLFQNITRARKRVKLVIINNEELLDRCMSILQ